MARHMGDNGEAFRAVIVRTTQHADGRVTTSTSYEGPYATVGAAKSRLTWAKRGRNVYRNVWDGSVTESTGHVERASTNWEPIDEPAEPTVTLTQAQYDALVSRDEELSALEAWGVDNWEGYDDALSGRGVDDE